MNLDQQSKITVAASLGASPNGGIAALANCSDWLEIRADLISDFRRRPAFDHFGGKLLYTLRSHFEGGKSRHSSSERRSLLLEAAVEYDLIDLEGERDLDPEILRLIPPEKRVISWSGPASDPGELEMRFATFRQHEAKLYRFVTRPSCLLDCFVPLQFLKSVSRSDVNASAAGSENLWTRLLALKLGAPVIFANADEARGDTESLEALKRLNLDYLLSSSNRVDRIFAIIGNPICGTRSPRLHNSAYRVGGLPALFVYLSVDSFSEFWTGVVEARAFELLGLPLQGFTVASPHKGASLAAAKSAAPLCRRANSCNLLLSRNGRWVADTTDASGILDCLKSIRFFPKRKRIAVVGCGGSGRAMAAALHEAGAEVVLVNRGRERGTRAARLLNLPWIPLAEFSLRGCSAVINATPVGGAQDMLPVDLSLLSEDSVVVDLVYADGETPLVRAARVAGIQTIDGAQILLAQVARQYKLMTGEEMPGFNEECATLVIAPARALSDY